VEFDDEDYRDQLGPKPVRKLRAEELVRSEIPQDFSHFSWDRVKPELREKVQAHIAKLHELEPKGYGVLFHGKEYGHGKTSLAIKCMMEGMSRGAVGGYFYMPTDMHSVFTQPFNHVTSTGKPIAKKLQDVQLLVLDELGEETASEKNRPWFKNLIRHRYNHRRLTYLTSNFGPDFFKTQFPWFWDILLERFQVIEVHDKRQRLINGQENSEETKT
jgi:DNA replication protein DnaC